MRQRPPGGRSWRATRRTGAIVRTSRRRGWLLRRFSTRSCPSFGRSWRTPPYRLVARNSVGADAVGAGGAEDAGKLYGEATEEFRSWQREGKAVGYAARRIEEIQVRLRTATGLARSSSQSSGAPPR
jgi:hypothetical protein